MAPSSSGSWDGAGADIIDLDRYMRGSVRPSRALSEDTEHCEQFVVDCGKPNVDITTTRYKHYSHDSGVSDGSYRQRRTRRPHRRISNPTSPPATYREPPSAPSAPSATPRSAQLPSDTLRQFKTACEQVLVDQQKQIARVAEVCERLERAENGRNTEGRSSGPSDPVKPKEERSERRMKTSEGVDKQSVKSKTPSKAKSSSEKKKMEVIISRQSSETSDLSSSTSRTSSDRPDVRKEKHRTSYAEECKTYKIIMRKLDELNRRFGPQQKARRPPSLSSVSVCDKLVATDPTPREAKTMQARTSITKVRLSRSRAVDTKMPPVEANMIGVKKRIVTSNNFSVKYESSSCRSVTGEESPLLSPFDLNDPMRLYTQAKNLQAMAATTTTRRRTHSVDVDSRTQRAEGVESARTRASARSHSKSERERSPSLCAMCRAYLRSLRQCLIAPLTDYIDANT